MIDAALEKLEVSGAIVVVHSLAGRAGRAAGAGLSAARRGPRDAGAGGLSVPGGVGWYNKVVTTPVIGPLLRLHRDAAARSHSVRTRPPAAFSRRRPCRRVLSKAPPRRCCCGPREFLANAWDLVTLKAAVAEQASRYGNIKAPVVVITGDTDTTVSPGIHSRRLAATVPNAKLIVLPGVGHMVQYAAPELVVRDIEAMIADSAAPKAAMR